MLPMQLKKRILAMAYRYGEELQEEDMIFLGLVALLDPPLEGVKESVKACKRARGYVPYDCNLTIS